MGDYGVGVIWYNLCITQPKACLFCHVQFVLNQAGRATQDCHSFIFPAQMLSKEGLHTYRTTSYLLNPLKSRPTAVKRPIFPSPGTLLFVCKYNSAVSVLKIRSPEVMSYQKSFQSANSTQPRPSISTYNVHLIRIKLVAG